MTRGQIEAIIVDTCCAFYQNYRHLIVEKANERNIASAYLAPMLRGRFQPFSVDAEYNREGSLKDRVTKVDLADQILLPDLIIHEHGPTGRNLVAIEVKGHWNNEPRQFDEDSLRRLREKHHYEFLYRIELGADCAELFRVE